MKAIDQSGIPAEVAAIRKRLGTHAHAGIYEPALGNPAADGYVLSSTMAGVRSWIPAAGSCAVFEGMIAPFMAGYFTDGSNGSYTRVLGTANTIAAVNTLMNPRGWYVCDGAALNLPASTIFNGAGRYLPNLTDDRFLMGDTTCGGIGGANSSAHTHGFGTIAAANESTHTHSISFTSGAGSSHSHGVGTLANAAEATHTHAAGSLANAAEAAHTHAAGSLANAAEAAHTHAVGSLAAAAEASHTHAAGAITIGAEASHTHSCDPPSTTTSTETLAGAAGSLANTSPYKFHTHTVDIAAFTSAAGSSHTHSASGAASGAGSSHTHAISGTTSAGSSHNHAISGSTAAGSSHNHAISGSTAAGSSHNHAISGSSAGEAAHTHDVAGTSAAGSAHTHSLSGDTGAASATENRPSFLSVFYLMYVLAT